MPSIGGNDSTLGLEFRSALALQWLQYDLHLLSELEGLAGRWSQLAVLHVGVLVGSSSIRAGWLAELGSGNSLVASRGLVTASLIPQILLAAHGHGRLLLPLRHQLWMLQL